jgi:hypothetical protein
MRSRWNCRASLEQSVGRKSACRYLHSNGSNEKRGTSSVTKMVFFALLNVSSVVKSWRPWTPREYQ